MKEQYANTESIMRLFKKLELLPPDHYTQDWEHELPHFGKLSAHFDLYENDKEMSDNERFTLLELTFGALNSKVISGEDISEYWQRLVPLITINRDLHQQTLDYWSSWDIKDPDDRWPLSKFVRSINSDVATDNSGNTDIGEE